MARITFSATRLTGDLKTGLLHKIDYCREKKTPFAGVYEIHTGHVSFPSPSCLSGRWEAGTPASAVCSGSCSVRHTQQGQGDASSVGVSLRLHPQSWGSTVHPCCPQPWTLRLLSGPQAPDQGTQPRRATGSNMLPPSSGPRRVLCSFPLLL